MTLTQIIRRQSARYVNRQITLDEFEEWLVAHTWNVQRTGDEGATTLSFEIEMQLSELSSGYATEDDLRTFLISLFLNQWADFEVIDDATTLTFSGAGTELVEVPA